VFALPPRKSSSSSRAAVEPTAKPGEDSCSIERRELLVKLDSADCEERVEAIRRLGQQGPEAAEALAKLRQTLKDPEPAIRAATAVAVGFVGSRKDGLLLLPLLDDPAEAVRFQTISALAFLGDPSVAAQLKNRYDDEAPTIRDQILRAIGQLGGPHAYPLLVRGIADPDVRIRRAAAVGFSFLKDIRARTLLQRAAETDPDELVAHEARIALHELDYNLVER
jgi:HEAT repeat protein